MKLWPNSALLTDAYSSPLRAQRGTAKRGRLAADCSQLMREKYNMRTFKRNVAIALLCLLIPATGSAEDKFFDSNGVRIRYVEQGSGEAIILLHGDGGSLNGWIDSDVLPNLAQHYRVIAFDARGSGKSGKPHEVKAYGREMGLDVVRLLDHLGIRRAHIVGQSMGAHVIAQLMTTHPERFITATLSAAAGRFQWPEEEIVVRTVQEPLERERECVSRTQILRLASPNAPKPDEEAIRRRSAACMANPDVDRFALAARTRAERAYIVTPEQLRNITVPTLAVVGSLDGYLADFTELKKLRPDVKLVVVDKATHSGVMRRPELVAAIRDFIESNRAAPSH